MKKASDNLRKYYTSSNEGYLIKDLDDLQEDITKFYSIG